MTKYSEFRHGKLVGSRDSRYGLIARTPDLTDTSTLEKLAQTYSFWGTRPPLGNRWAVGLTAELNGLMLMKKEPAVDRDGHPVSSGNRSFDTARHLILPKDRVIDAIAAQSFRLFEWILPVSNQLQSEVNDNLAVPEIPILENAATEPTEPTSFSAMLARNAQIKTANGASLLLLALSALLDNKRLLFTFDSESLDFWKSLLLLLPAVCRSEIAIAMGTVDESSCRWAHIIVKDGLSSARSCPNNFLKVNLGAKSLEGDWNPQQFRFEYVELLRPLLDIETAVGELIQVLDDANDVEISLTQLAKADLPTVLRLSIGSCRNKLSNRLDGTSIDSARNVDSTVTKSPLSASDDIQHYLLDASPEQTQRFAQQVNRFDKLKRFFQQFPERKGQFQAQIERAAKALNYKRPYRIAVIGTAGAGKSTLINALLGRELVLTKSIGKPATGAALNIFLDVKEGDQEIATVTYRDEQNIRQLIDDFVGLHALSGIDISAPLDAKFKSTLAQLVPDSNRHEALQDFLGLRDALINMLAQYISRGSRERRIKYLLSSEQDCQALAALVDEGSDYNENPSTREIGLIKSVTYHIKPARNTAGLPTLKLPNNVCLVDLPGLDGTPLHDLIIGDGIREADAVVFVMRPPRILGRGDKHLLNRVSRYISIEGNAKSGDRIFLVLNAKDSITSDANNQQAFQNLPRDMRALTELLMPGYGAQFPEREDGQPYFETSAWAAYAAQTLLQGRALQDSNTYESIKIKLGMKGADDLELLEASRVPSLVQSLTHFASEHLIEGQIRDAQQTLDSIVTSLRLGYESDANRLTKNRGEFYVQQKVDERLEDQQKALEDEIVQFRAQQLKRFDEWQSHLETVSQTVCDETDRVLQSKLPLFWNEAFSSRRIRTSASRTVQLFSEFVLGQVQAELWTQLSLKVPLLSAQLAQLYMAELSAYKMAHRISKSTHSCLSVAEVNSTLQDFIETHMRHSLIQVGERIALTEMTDPRHNFIALETNSQSIHQKMTDSLLQVPNQRTVDTVHFQPLIMTVRLQYEPFVSQYCVTRLLNLYRYEMLLVEEHLLDLVQKTYDSIRRSSDPLLKARINEALSNPELKQVESIRAKLADLSQL